MPRDGLHLPKGDRLISRKLSSWIAQFIVPALVNRAAELEMAARRLMEEPGPRRRMLRSRVAAEPVSALVAIVGVVYLLGVIGRRRR